MRQCRRAVPRIVRMFVCMELSMSAGAYIHTYKLVYVSRFANVACCAILLCICLLHSISRVIAARAHELWKFDAGVRKHIFENSYLVDQADSNAYFAKYL